MSLIPLYPTRGTGISMIQIGGLPGSSSTLPLSSAFTYGVTGSAFSNLFISPGSFTITDFWCVGFSVTGTGSPDGYINWYIHSGFSPLTNYTPGSAVVASGTIPVSALKGSGWTKVSNLSVPVSAGNWYHLVIADTDCNSSNFVIMYRNGSGTGMAGVINNTTYTSDGWATAGTITGLPGAIAFKTSTGEIWGGGVIANSNTSFTSNVSGRGIKLTFQGNTPPLRFIGFGGNYLAAFGNWTVKIFRGIDATPTSTPYWSWTVPAGADFTGSQFNSIGNQILTTPQQPLLLPNETWYIVLFPDIAATTPQMYNTWTSPDSDIISIMSGMAGCSATCVQQASDTTWTETASATLYAMFNFVPATIGTIAT